MDVYDTSLFYNFNDITNETRIIIGQELKVRLASHAVEFTILNEYDNVVHVKQRKSTIRSSESQRSP